MVELGEDLIEIIMKTPKYKEQFLGSGTEGSNADYVMEQVAEMCERWEFVQRINKELMRLNPEMKALFTEAQNEMDVLFRVGAEMDERPELKEYVGEQVLKIAPKRAKLAEISRQVDDLSKERDMLITQQGEQFQRLMELETPKLADIERQIKEENSQKGVEVG